MKSLNKLLIFSLFFIPFFVNAESTITCINSNDSGYGWPTNTDCIESTPGGGGVFSIAPDRKSINFVTSGNEIAFIQISNQDWTNFASYWPGVKVWNESIDYILFDTYGDGIYTLIYVLENETSNYPPIPIYVYKGKFYLNNTEIDQVTKTDNNLNFGIMIIIVLMSLMFIGYIYNRTVKKQPWK